LESTLDLKWVAIVSVGVLFIALFNYAFLGGYYSRSRDFWMAMTHGFHAVFLFFNVSTLTMATICMTGKRSNRLHSLTMVFFIFSMIFLFLALSLALWIEPLTYAFMG
jgi:hypothetical protein